MMERERLGLWPQPLSLFMPVREMRVPVVSPKREERKPTGRVGLRSGGIEDEEARVQKLMRRQVPSAATAIFARSMRHR